MLGISILRDVNDSIAETALKTYKGDGIVIGDIEKRILVTTGEASHYTKTSFLLVSEHPADIVEDVPHNTKFIYSVPPKDQKAVQDALMLFCGTNEGNLTKTAKDILGQVISGYGQGTLIIRNSEVNILLFAPSVAPIHLFLASFMENAKYPSVGLIWATDKTAVEKLYSKTCFIVKLASLNDEVLRINPAAIASKWKKWVQQSPYTAGIFIKDYIERQKLSVWEKTNESQD